MFLLYIDASSRPHIASGHPSIFCFCCARKLSMRSTAASIWLCGPGEAYLSCKYSRNLLIGRISEHAPRLSTNELAEPRVLLILKTRNVTTGTPGTESTPPSLWMNAPHYTDPLCENRRPKPIAYRWSRASVLLRTDFMRQAGLG